MSDTTALEDKAAKIVEILDSAGEWASEVIRTVQEEYCGQCWTRDCSGSCWNDE